MEMNGGFLNPSPNQLSYLISNSNPKTYSFKIQILFKSKNYITVVRLYEMQLKRHFQGNHYWEQCNEKLRNSV